MTTPPSPGNGGSTPDWYERRIDAMKRAMDEWGTRKDGGQACDPFQSILPNSIASMMASRQAFTEEARHFVSTTLIMYSAAGALIVVPYTQSPSDSFRDMVCHGLAALCLLMVWPVTEIMMKTAEAGYELYVSNSIYAAIAHRAAGVGKAPPVTPDDSMDRTAYEARMRTDLDQPHSWLDGVERSRNRVVHFVEPKQTAISKFIDARRGWPEIINRWGSMDAFPKDHVKAKRAKPPRVAEEPRELCAAWSTTGQTLLHSLQQMQWLARRAASWFALLLLLWTSFDVVNEYKLTSVVVPLKPALGVAAGGIALVFLIAGRWHRTR